MSSPVLYYQRDDFLQAIILLLDLRSKQNVLLAFARRELDGVSVPNFFLHTLPSHVTAVSYNSLQNVVTVNVGSEDGVKNRNICAAGSNGEKHGGS